MRSGYGRPAHVITRRVAFDDAAEAMLDPTNKMVFLA
jgi:hypothetical protein